MATPGRLLDHLEEPYARLGGLEVLVLDEADRMLDMGFLPDIRRVLQRLPAKRQTLFFSATMPPPIVALAREILREPVTIAVERPAAPATGITHSVYPVASELKSRLLLALLARPATRSVLAFTRTKHRANRLAEFLGRHGIRVERIHGNRSQTQRTQALAGFKDGRYQVLVATDIAARGIDIDALSHVVNFDVPALPEEYIHRVGRTARMEARGDAVTLVAPTEEADLRAIERAIGTRLPRVTLPDFDYAQGTAERLEIPLAERLAAMRAQRASARRNAMGRPPTRGRHRPVGLSAAGARYRAGARVTPGGQQSRAHTSGRGPLAPSARRSPPATRSSISSRIIRTNAGCVPAVPARTNPRPSAAARARASVSRSYTTSMWSDTKPTGATTTSVTPSPRSVARCSSTSGSSHGSRGDPLRLW